jgi:hypothetical protein
MVMITRTIREECGIDFRRLVDEALLALETAKEQGDVKASIAAIGLLGRLTGFELEAQARRDSEYGKKVAAVVAAVDGKSARDIINENAPKAAAFMCAVASGELPSDPKTQVDASKYVLNRAEGVPVGADIVQADQISEKLGSRLKLLEDRSLRVVNG